MKKLILFLLFIPFFSFSQSSMNMSLLGSLSYPTTNCSDIWGWEDGLGNEYALVGLGEMLKLGEIMPTLQQKLMLGF